MKKKILLAMSMDNMSLNAEEENVQMDNQLSPRSGGSNDDDYWKKKTPIFDKYY